MDPPNLTLDDLFTQDIKNPFTYDLNLQNTSNTIEALFEQLKSIFVKGLMIVTNGEALNDKIENSIDINKMTEKDFKNVRERMLSIGIEAKYKVLDINDKDYYLRGLLYDIQNINGLKLMVTQDWNTQMIHKIDFNLNDKSVLPKLIEKIEKHSEANYFLNMAKPKNLKDYIIKYVKKDEEDKLHVIYFDAANITDYHYQHKFCDKFTRHVK